MGSLTRQRITSKALRIIYKFGPKFVLSPNLSRFVLNYIDPYLYIDHWSSQPFNGQNVRYRQIMLISEFLKPTVAIETGTYLGTSTPALANLVSTKTFTIELDKEFAQKSKSRFEKKFKPLNINVMQGDSAVLIEKILNKLNPDFEVILAYFDAHWESEIPIQKELLAISSWGGSWIAIIDDFRVPDDDSYGFDRYGSTVVDKTIIPFIEGIQILVPRSSAIKETGAKKGTAYVFSPLFCNFNLENQFPQLRKITR